MIEDNKNYEEWDDEIDFKKIYKILLNGKNWIIGCATIAAIISIVYALFFTTKIYTSESTILLTTNTSTQSRLSGIASQFGFSVQPQKTGVEYLSMQTIPEFLSSRTLAKNILSSKITNNDHNGQLTLFDLIARDYPDEKDSENLESIVISRLANQIIGVKQLRDAPIFKLYINTKAPELSAEIGRFTLNELRQLHSSFTSSDIYEEKTFISGRLQEVEKKLSVTENKLKNFREKNLQINLSPSLMLMEERLRRDLEVQTQVYISLKQQFEQIQINESKNTYNLKIIDEPNIPIKPSKPNRRLIVIISTLFGIFIGSTVAIIKEYKK